MNYYYSFCWCFQGVCSEYHLVVRYWLSWCLGASGDHSPTPTSSSLLYNVHPIFYQQHLGHWAVLFVMPALYSARHCPTVVLTPASSTRHRPPKTYSISDCIHSLELQRIGVVQCSSVPVSPVRLGESQMVYFDVTFIIPAISPMKRFQEKSFDVN